MTYPRLPLLNTEFHDVPRYQYWSQDTKINFKYHNLRMSQDDLRKHACLKLPHFVKNATNNGYLGQAQYHVSGIKHGIK